MPTLRFLAAAAVLAALTPAAGATGPSSGNGRAARAEAQDDFARAFAAARAQGALVLVDVWAPW
jgi:hypothetical protein